MVRLTYPMPTVLFVCACGQQMGMEVSRRERSLSSAGRTLLGLFLSFHRDTYGHVVTERLIGAARPSGLIQWPAAAAGGT